MDASSSGSSPDDDPEWRNISENTSYFYTNSSYPPTLYDVPAGLIVLLSVLYGSISVLAVLGNFLVMWIVATSRRMQSVTNYFIANLALADIAIGLFAVPFQFQAALLQRWLLPHFMCPFCPFIQALSVNVSVFTLTAIAVDRHRAIITPLSAHTSKRIAKVIIVLIWILALVLASPIAMSYEVVMVELEKDPATNILHQKPFCDTSEFGSKYLSIIRLALYIFQYVIPLFVISYAYVHMTMKLWGARAPGNAQETRDANQMKNKKKVIKMLVLVVALFAFCWLPLQSYLLLQTYFESINEYRYINVLFFCFDWLAMSNSCYNPFIYAIYNEKFKKEFKQRFTFRKKKSSRFINDSIEDGPSYRTRVVSFRSTNDRRKSISTTQNDSIRTIRNSICYKDRFKPEENGCSKRTQSLQRSAAENIKSRRKHYLDDTIPLECEKVTELFIFPHSNIVEFTDTIHEEKM